MAFFSFVQKGNLAVVSPFQKRFFLFAEDRRHALSFLGKGADEVLLFLFRILFFFCFVFKIFL